MDYEVTIEQLPSRQALVVRATATMQTIPQVMGAAFGALMAHATGSGTTFAGPPFAYYPQEEYAEGEPFGVWVGFPVAAGATAGPGVSLEELPGGAVARTRHQGPYAGVRHAYEALQSWMAANGRSPAGGCFEVYLNDPETVPEDELQTEVCWYVGPETGE
jgi:effector-binding domain-containing protein